MSTGFFKKLILGTGLSGTDNGDNTITIDVTSSGTPDLTAVLTEGNDAGGIEIRNGATPTTPASLTPKFYVDSVAQGLSIKQSCRLATAAALPAVTLVGSTLVAVGVGVLTIDGQAVALNDRILVKDQVAGAQNGIYNCTTAGTSLVAFILTRASDSDTSAEIVGGFTFIEEGTVNAASGFVNTNSGTITVGTTAITYTQFSGAGEITAGAALTKTGNTLDVAVDGTTIEVTADALNVKAGGIGPTQLASTAVTPATYGDATHVAVFTVDADGRITSATSTAISGGGGGGSFVSTDPIWVAKGDLVVGLGTASAARLAVGANGTTPVAASSETVGVKWAFPPGYELGYVEITTDVSVASTTEATPTLVASLGSISYAAVPTLLEFFTPKLFTLGTKLIVLSLWDGVPGSGGTNLGILGVFDARAAPTTAATIGAAFLGCRRLTPSAGSHTYGIYTWMAVGTSASSGVSAGSGGAGANLPAYIRAVVA